MLSDVAIRYGKTSKLARMLEKAVNANTALRNEMDNQLFRDCPGIKEPGLGVYYGPSGEVKAMK